jgi:hypothetical protein
MMKNGYLIPEDKHATVISIWQYAYQPLRVIVTDYWRNESPELQQQILNVMLKDCSSKNSVRYLTNNRILLKKIIA